MTFAYHNDPAKTAASHRNSHAPLGDIGYLDADGYLYLADRRDDLIISGGVNIYPAEVEARLIEHRAAQDVAVIGAPDPEWGAIVTAVVQPVQGIAATEDFAEELKRWCRAGIARPKVPRQVIFTSSLPRSQTGKLSRRRVREQLARRGLN